MLKSSQDASTDFEDHECPGCGLKREQWSASAGQKDFPPRAELIAVGEDARKKRCVCVRRISSKKSVSVRAFRSWITANCARIVDAGEFFERIFHVERRSVTQLGGQTQS